MMKIRARLLLLLLVSVFLLACHWLSAQEKAPALQLQAHLFWTDPATGLMWAGRDNGKDVSWKGAVRYCRNLRAGGFVDWRLASLDEEGGIYNKAVDSPGENPRSRWHDAEPMNFHVLGDLFLTGEQWTSSERMDDGGKPTGYAWRFDFNEGGSFGGDEKWFATDKRALCVRGAARP